MKIATALFLSFLARTDCEITKYLSEDKAMLGFSGYNGYPSQFCKDKNVLILLEGLMSTAFGEKILIKGIKRLEA